jgi:pimeloyl-ACP methyl ester carboxylesterase
MSDPKLVEYRRRQGGKSVIVFIHGFSGDAAETFDKFPMILEKQTPIDGWDVFSVGYTTTLLPGTRGLWSSAPDLPKLAIYLKTQLTIPPLSEYDHVTILAHSMGGLVVQRALLDDPRLADRIHQLLLFGTPSGGLKKASVMARLLGPLFSRQVGNMGHDSEFITTLRAAWSDKFEPDSPFGLYVVAGDTDQFVPESSSLEPFPKDLWRVIAGDHLRIVKPQDADHQAVRLFLAAFGEGHGPQPVVPAPPMSAPSGSSAPADEQRILTGKEVVDLALALDRAGKRKEAIDLLQRNEELGTDVKGTLAGRHKRIWLQEGDEDQAERALELYGTSLEQALAAKDSAQIYYHAINVAFIEFLAHDDIATARDRAQLALEHAEKLPADIWSVATKAEAALYLDRQADGLTAYKQATTMTAERWQLISAGQQAQHIAAKLGDEPLADALEKIFAGGNPG